MIDSGIYKIVNINDGKVYIGSAINFTTRWRLHKNYLKLGRHYNKHLQYAYNKYGLELFKFEIIEIIEDLSKLLEREQFWIDLSRCCNDKFGYNLNPTAGSNLGRKYPIKKYGYSLAAKAKMSLAAKGKSKDHLRKPDKWPHEKGNKCRCEECFNKRRKYGRDYHRDKGTFSQISLQFYF